MPKSNTSTSSDRCRHVDEVDGDLHAERQCGAGLPDQPAEHDIIAERQRRRPDPDDEVGFGRARDALAAAHRAEQDGGQRHLQQRSARRRPAPRRSARAAGSRAIPRSRPTPSDCAVKATVLMRRKPNSQNMQSNSTEAIATPPSSVASPSRPIAVVETMPISGVVRFATIAGPAMANTCAVVTLDGATGACMSRARRSCRHGRPCRAARPAVRACRRSYGSGPAVWR